MEEIALKIDISKAFDRVNWGYLVVIKKWAFMKNDLVGLIYVFRLSNMLWLLMDTQLDKFFSGENLGRMTHYLSTLLKYHEMKCDIHRVKMCKGTHILTHLLFSILQGR